MEGHSRLTIRGVRARGLDLALARPVETAAGAMRTTPLVLIDLFTEEGITGRSYVRCYTPVALRPLVELVANLQELLKDAAANPAAVEGRLQRHFRFLGPQGLTGMAMAGIDMALWDAQAKAAGVPLVTLLSGEAKPIPAYTTLRTMRAREAAAEAEEMLQLGFTAIKVKLGRGDVAADLETIRAVRSAVGDGIDLMVDYNQSLSVAEALDRARVLDQEGLYWIEEPTRADDFEGHARIAAAATTPIQLGENWWGPHDMEKSIAARASDHATLDVMKLGGVTGWLRAAALAEAASLPASSHTFPEYSVQLLAVTPTCHRLEYLDHAGAILTEPVRIEQGRALPANRPGSGLEWNEELVARLLAQRVGPAVLPAGTPPDRGGAPARSAIDAQAHDGAMSVRRPAAPTGDEGTARPAVAIGTSREFRGYDADQARAFAAAWLPAWTGNDPHTLAAFYTHDTFYSDPQVPDGVHGRAALIEYLTGLLARYPDWVWTQTGSAPMRDGFINYWDAMIPVAGDELRLSGLCLVVLRDGLIARNEVFFDRTPLVDAIRARARE